MKNKTKIICIDALKPEHIQYMPYLKSLTEKYMHGRLTPPLGFMSAEEVFLKGKSNILAFFYYNKNSFTKWTKKFSFLEIFGFYGRFFLNIVINIQAIIKRKHLMRTYNLPIKRLWYLDTEIKSIRSNKNMDYIYINELDKIAHKYGTFSEKTIKCLRKIDRKLKKINFDILFSDHGMMDINKVIKVPESEICIIDSTLARYFGKKEELEKIKIKLPLKSGRIINWPDKKYGQLIFLANPGCLILPNFWQGNCPVKAMHGYDNYNKEMHGFYLIKKQGKERSLFMKELHESFKELWKN